MHKDYYSVALWLLLLFLLLLLLLLLFLLLLLHLLPLCSTLFGSGSHAPVLFFKKNEILNLLYFGPQITL